MFKKKIKLLPKDDFISRLPSSVIGEGMLHKGNPYLFDAAIRQMPKNGYILEIGSYGGLSVNLINYFLTKYNKSAKIFNCDPWIYEGYHDSKENITENMDGRIDVLRKDYMNHIMNSYISSTKLLSKNNLPATFRLKSDDFFDQWKNTATSTDVFGNDHQLGGNISFAYIDGDHSYQQSKRDFENILKFLVDGGLILFDDSGKGMPFGSAKFVLEILKEKNIELVDQNPNHLIRVLKN